MTEVKIRKGESVEKALRRLKKKLDREGIMRDIRAKRHFEKPSEKRRRKAARARNQLQQHQSLLSQPAIGDLQSFTFTPTTMALAIDRDAEPSRASEASSGSTLSGHSPDTANNTPTDWDSISRLRRELQAISQLLIA